MDLDVLRAALRVRLSLPVGEDGINALRKAMPQRHAVEWPLTEAADYVLRQFATGESETQFIQRLPDCLPSVAPTKDKFRE